MLNTSISENLTSMALRKKRLSPKSDEANKFLCEYLAGGAEPVSKVLAAAQKLGISSHTLIPLSQPLVNKRRQKGPDGSPTSYWSLRTSPSFNSATPASVRENSAAFNSGYGQAIDDMLLRLNSIGRGTSNIEAKKIYLTLREALYDLKSNNR